MCNSFSQSRVQSQKNINLRESHAGVSEVKKFGNVIGKRKYEELGTESTLKYPTALGNHSVSK